jgi:hypothetical protein
VTRLYGSAKLIYEDNKLMMTGERVEKKQSWPILSSIMIMFGDEINLVEQHHNFSLKFKLLKGNALN